MWRGDMRGGQNGSIPAQRYHEIYIRPRAIGFRQVGTFQAARGFDFQHNRDAPLLKPADHVGGKFPSFSFGAMHNDADATVHNSNGLCCFSLDFLLQAFLATLRSVHSLTRIGLDFFTLFVDCPICFICCFTSS